MEFGHDQKHDRSKVSFKNRGYSLDKGNNYKVTK